MAMACTKEECMVMFRQIIGIQHCFTRLVNKAKALAFQDQCSSCNPAMT